MNTYKNFVAKMASLIMLLLLWHAPLCGQEKKYYANSNIDFRKAEEEAAKGNLIAINHLGDQYRYGQGNYPLNKTKALVYYKEAAGQGYPLSMNSIATFYHYGWGGLPIDEEKSNEWHEKAFENCKIYANQGDKFVMSQLVEYYSGLSYEAHKDPLLALYWSLRMIEIGGYSGAADVARFLTYDHPDGKPDHEYALCWYARYALGYYEHFPQGGHEIVGQEELNKAGYSRQDYDKLASYTNISVPYITSQKEDSIRDVALFTFDLLKLKSEEMRIEHRMAQKKREAASINQTAATPVQRTVQQTKRPRRKWLSAIGQILDVAAGAGNASNFVAGIVNGIAGQNTANNNGTLMNQDLQRLFSYTGNQRKGQRDNSGHVISDEYNLPAPMGQMHYIYYEDGYGSTTTVTTCVICYGHKNCQACQGKGKIFNSYFKNYVPCRLCNGSGVCNTCHGRGGQVMSKLWAPGEAQAYMESKREVENEMGSTPNNSSSNQGSKICSDCGGKGYRRQKYTYAAQSAMAPYHNSGGNTCTICGDVDDHYHYRCTTCKRH